MTTPDTKHLTNLAAILGTTLTGAKKDIDEKESMLVVAGLPITPDFVKERIHLLEEKITDARAILEDVIELKSYLTENLIGFARVCPIVEKYTELLEVFNSAKAWTNEELTAMKAVDAHYQENLETLRTLGGKTLDEYLKAKEKYMANNNK